MNPEVKQLWLDALRSGEYKQTTQVLHDENGFCCLGVLTDLYRQENGGEWLEPTNSFENKPTIEYYTFINRNYCDGQEIDILPWTVVNWAGLNDQVPHLADNYITNLNDGGMSFNAIAKLIEEQL